MTPLPLPDADLTFTSDCGIADNSGTLQQLIAETPWQQREITLWGKTRLQPRLTAWYGDSGKHYTYSGIRHAPLPWTKLLLELKTQVEHHSGEHFNSVLLNYYRNEHDSMGMHSDDEPELGPEPVIASLSLGEERTLCFKHKTRRDLQRYRLRLPSGSLLLMRGQTQAHWQHGIDKERKPCGPRINLTFRSIV